MIPLFTWVFTEFSVEVNNMHTTKITRYQFGTIHFGVEYLMLLQNEIN